MSWEHPPFAPFADAGFAEKAKIRIVSLGAGVQSTTMLLMAAKGEFGPLPVSAIFADTGWEPAAVYRHLDWLEKEVGGIVPIRRVSAGNIRDSFYRAQSTNKRYVMLPTFVKMPDGGAGLSRRQCTKEFKLTPLRQEVRRVMAEHNLKPTPGVLEQWIGISLDEAHRMKDSGVRYATNVYPLIERRMTRQSCIAWLEKNGYPIPEKSACLGCPFHGNAYWREMKDRRPEEWAQVVEFDQAIRKGGPRGELIGENYLHRSLVPLDEVDLRSDLERGQLEMFGNECEGMCGV